MMYLLFFILARNARSNKNFLTGAAAFVCAGVLLGALKQFGFNFPILGVCQGMIGFFSGCITAGIYNHCARNKKSGRIVTAACVCMILASFFLSAAPGYIPVFSAFLAYSSMGYWVMVYTFLLFPPLIFVVLRIKLLSRAFSVKPLRYLGQISYSIYLIHFPAAFFIVTADELLDLKINYSKSIVFFAYMALVLLLSHFSHFRFEIPVQAWIRKKAPG
jgi:peptidoglycan/LPS O-acetylase OafA/YrhL